MVSMVSIVSIVSIVCMVSMVSIGIPANVIVTRARSSSAAMDQLLSASGALALAGVFTWWLGPQRTYEMVVRTQVRKQQQKSRVVQLHRLITLFYNWKPPT
jgi:hypothetical protein